MAEKKAAKKSKLTIKKVPKEAVNKATKKATKKNAKILDAHQVADKFQEIRDQLPEGYELVAVVFPTSCPSCEEDSGWTFTTFDSIASAYSGIGTIAVSAQQVAPKITNHKSMRLFKLASKSAQGSIKGTPKVERGDE